MTRVLSAAVLAAMVCGAGVTGCDKLRGPQGPQGKDGKPGRAGLDGEVAQHGKPCVQDADCGGLLCDGHSKLCRNLTDSELAMRELARRQERVAKTHAAVEAAQAELDHARQACVDNEAKDCPAEEEARVKLERAALQLAHDDAVAAEALPGAEAAPAAKQTDGKKAASGGPLQTASDLLLALQMADAVCRDAGGTCFDSGQQECSVESLRGKCGGGKTRVCCPKGGTVAEKPGSAANKPNGKALADAKDVADKAARSALEMLGAVLAGHRDDLDNNEERIAANEAAVKTLQDKAGVVESKAAPAKNEEAPEPTAAFRPPWVAEGTATWPMIQACVLDRARRFGMRGMDDESAVRAAGKHCDRRYGLVPPAVAK